MQPILSTRQTKYFLIHKYCNSIIDGNGSIRIKIVTLIIESFYEMMVRSI